MKYEIIAHFYEHEGDSKALLRSPISILKPFTLNYFDENGWLEDKESTEGYMDYIKTVTINELQDYTDYEAIPEVMAILEREIDESHIELHACELDYIDDNGHIPPRVLYLGEKQIIFEGIGPFDDVIIRSKDGDSRHNLFALKKKYEVTTMFELMDKFKEMWATSILDDLVPVAVDWDRILCVQSKDKEREDALGIMIHCDSRRYGIGLVAKFLKFCYMDILEDTDEVQGKYRDIIKKSATLEDLYWMMQDFLMMRDDWTELENKFLFETTEVKNY